MSLVIIANKGNEEEWQDQLTKLHPGLEVQIYPEDTNREEIKFALAWNPPKGVFANYPNLQCIASTGAGVDHILKDPDLPADVAVTRVVDHRLTRDMTAYLVTVVMAHLRDLYIYKQSQQEHAWLRHDYKIPEETRIGIMGMGELGKHASLQFLDLGFKVSGWARSTKQVEKVQMYAGDEALNDFLKDINILVCLLPLTKDTKGILSRSLMEKLPKGAYIINVARGEHLVENDLLELIETRHVSGASLDVFSQEPLPADHPFWENDKIRVTPHVASITSVQNVAPQIIENYRRMLTGQPLLNEVSLDRGY